MKSLYYSIIMRIFIGIVIIPIVFFIPSQLMHAQHFENRGIESFDNSPKDGLPPGWEVSPGTGNPHGVIVVLGANPRINDIPIHVGDYIGAFYMDDFGELKCGGADFWNGTENIIFTVSGDNNETPEKDGFSYAETMHFKVYYQDNQKDYDVTSIAWDPSFSQTNKWIPLGVSSAIDMVCIVEFDAYATLSENPICTGQTIDLAANIFIGTTGSYTYQWSSNPVGLNSTSQNTSHTPLESTIYTLEVFDGTITSIHNLPVVVLNNPEIFPGDDLTICENQNAQLTAQATNYSSIIWETFGDGTFQNPGSLQAIYHPGIQDKENEIAELSVSALPINPCQQEVSGNLTIFLQSVSEISLPATLEFCEIGDMMVEAQASLYSSVFWSTSGDGSFSNPEALITQYFPGPSDLNINEFILTANVSSLAPCVLTNFAQASVSTFNGPTLNAPASKTVCENNNVNLNSIAFNSSATLWTTSGDGTFENPQMAGTVYYPGINDKATGGTSVTVYAFGNGVCQESSISKNVQIILVSAPTANAGEDLPVCKGGTVNPTGSVNNSPIFSWSTGGDGYFNNIYSQTPVYYPGSNDFNSPSFKLYLTAMANYPCNLPAVDSILINVHPEPDVEIGLNTASICQGDYYYFGQALALNYASVNWFTINGSGTFDDNALLNPSYFPDPQNDFPLGSIIIGLTALPLEPCTTSTDDFMTLIIAPNPNIDAGIDATMIQGETFTPQAVGGNYTSVLWSTSGDGTFDLPATLYPQYSPGTTDILNNTATLSIVAQPLSTCTTIANDDMVLTILNEQNILLTEGIQSFSTYINVDDKTFEEVISPIESKVVFAQHFLQVYWPEYDINTFGDFEVGNGATLVLNANTSLSLSGFETINKTITLTKGWNILPILTPCGVSAQHIFNQLGQSLIIINEVDGDNTFYPSGGIATLENLQTGKSYLIKVSEDKNFIFPDCEK